MRTFSYLSRYSSVFRVASESSLLPYHFLKACALLLSGYPSRKEGCRFLYKQPPSDSSVALGQSPPALLTQVFNRTVGIRQAGFGLEPFDFSSQSPVATKFEWAHIEEPVSRQRSIYLDTHIWKIWLTRCSATKEIPSLPPHMLFPFLAMVCLDQRFSNCCLANVSVNISLLNLSLFFMGPSVLVNIIHHLYHGFQSIPWYMQKAGSSSLLPAA